MLSDINKRFVSWLIYAIAALSIFQISGKALAHENIAIHPRITDKAIRLLLNKENQNGLYSGIEYYAGRDQNYDPQRIGLGDYSDENSIVNGSVLEDENISDDLLPAIYRTWSHFYHPYTEKPLQTWDLIDYNFNVNGYSSKDSARIHFEKAIKNYGYPSVKLKGVGLFAY